MHRSVAPVSNRISNGTKSIKVGNNFSDVEGDSKAEVNYHKLNTQKVEFENVHMHHHGGTGSKQAERGAVDAQANLQPLSESRMKSGVADLSLAGETKGDVKHEPQPSELKVKPDIRNPHGLVVPVRSDDESDGNTVLGAQTKHRVLSEKPDFQSKDALVDTQAKYGGQLSEPKSKPVVSNRQAQVNIRSSSKLEAADGHIPARHKVLSYKPDVVNHGAQMPLGSEQESTRHRQLSKLKQDIHAQVPMAIDSMDAQAAHGPVSELKTKSGVAKQAPIKTGHESSNAASAKSGLLPSVWKVEPDRTPAKANLKTEGATMDKHVHVVRSLNSKVKPAVTSRNASNNYPIYRPPPEPKTGLKNADSSASKVHDIVMYVNSNGHTVRVVKRRSDASLKTKSTQHKYGTVKRANYTQVNPAPPLVLNTSSYSSRSTNPLDQENFDLDSDPRYAHLPPSVKKKLAEIRKNRLNRIKYIRLIRKRCEGKKYCLQHVKSNERSLHDNCFYDAIMAEEKDGIELNPCHCSLIYTTGKRTRVINPYSHSVVSSLTEVTKVHPLVALVSLPGSGNTWVRGLLEEATGYCTGSMWCDPVLRAKQFCAEGIRSNTLVVKNHDPNIRWLKEKLAVNSSNLTKPAFSSAIFIHRDPYEATIAEWNRALGYKVYNATKHNFTVTGIGYYNTTAVKEQHTVSFGKEAFGRYNYYRLVLYLHDTVVVPKTTMYK